METLYRL